MLCRVLRHWGRVIQIAALEHETSVLALAIDDLNQWMGRLAALYGVTWVGVVETSAEVADLFVDISVARPRAAMARA